MSAKNNTDSSQAHVDRKGSMEGLVTAKSLVNSTSRPIREHFDTQYMTYLYEKLLRSVGKIGNVENFARNVSMLRHVIKQHYASKPCISDLRDSLEHQREQLFRPFFRHIFDKDGLKDYNVQAQGNNRASMDDAKVETAAVLAGDQTALNPLAKQQFCPEYMVRLYVCLLKSVGKVGNLENFRRNLHLLTFIIDQHYGHEDCIGDFSDSLKAKREKFFRPFFDNVFVQHGLEDL